MGSSNPPAPFATVTPRIVVEDIEGVEGVAAFLRTVFGARGDVPADRPAVMIIDDCAVMVSAAGVRQRFPAFLYVYVADVDATYARALAAGAESVEKPDDLPYGDRRGMVADRFGNRYQIARAIDS